MSAQLNTVPLDIQEAGYVIEMKIGAGGMTFPVAGMVLVPPAAAPARIAEPRVKQ